MSIVSNAILTFTISSTILTGTASESVESFESWYMKGGEGPFYFTHPQEFPIQFDKSYQIYTKDTPTFLLKQDTLKIFGILRTNEKVYRMTNQVQLSQDSYVTDTLPISHPLAVPSAVESYPNSDIDPILTMLI
jgi:hypothetical protein